MTALNADASDALTKLFDCQTTVFNVDVIKCTLTVVCWRGLNNANCTLNVKKIASDFERSNALTRLSVMSDDCIWFWTIRCTGEIIWLSDCCIWSWNGQMHADDYLLRKFVDQTSFAMKRLLSDCRASKLLIWCQKNCTRFRTIKCTDGVVCDENSLQSTDCNVICDEVEEAKVRCWYNVIRYDVEDFASDFERSNALTIVWFLLKRWRSIAMLYAMK